MCSIPSRMGKLGNIEETCTRYKCFWKHANSFPWRFIESDARKNSSPKALAKVKSNQSLKAFSFFSWFFHNVGLESFRSPWQSTSVPIEAHVVWHKNKVLLTVSCWDWLNRDCVHCHVLEVSARLLGGTLRQSKRDSSQRKIYEVFAVLKTNLITACARKNKPTARVLANALKERNFSSFLWLP